MSLADALSTPPARRRTTRCLLGQIIDSLPEADLSALAQALLDERFTSTAIHTALISSGHTLARSTLVVHRQGRCVCRSLTH